MGIVPIAEAIKASENAGLDLVLIAPAANPPVCKIIDYGKFRYELTLIGDNNKSGREMVARMLKLFSAQKENRGLFVSADLNPLE